MTRLQIPLTKNKIATLKAGQQVLLSGSIFTARDQAHKRLVRFLRKNKKLPLELKNKIIYYCGPTATPKGKVIGSCGPTTSSRMDVFVEVIMKEGLLGMIGKGRRAKHVRDIIKKYRGVYFIAPGGCGALLATRVVMKKIVCFKDLGPEAICELEIKDFPLIVGIDTHGKDIYAQP